MQLEQVLEKVRQLESFGYTKSKGLRVISIRHPMLTVILLSKRFKGLQLTRIWIFHECTIEEKRRIRTTYNQKFSYLFGVDYEAILKEVELEGPDVIFMDGGNNDFPFYKSDLSNCCC